jgi:hypothetical protein
LKNILEIVRTVPSNENEPKKREGFYIWISGIKLGCFKNIVVKEILKIQKDFPDEFYATAEEYIVKKVILEI